jgi:hypothetical protein
MNENKQLYGVVAGGIILLLIAIAGLTFYLFGYRVNSTGIVRPLTVRVENIPERTEVYINNESRGFKSGNKSFRLSPGFYTLIFAKDGYWPYIEQVVVSRSLDLDPIRPFLISQEPEIEIINADDERYSDITSLFATNNLPTQESPILSENNKVALYLSNGRLYARFEGDENEMPRYFCTLNTCGTIEVFNPLSEVRNLSFYKDRDDVFMIAMERGIFAIEINPSEMQNLQPIIEGESPDYRISAVNKIFVKDGPIVAEIGL